LEETFVARYKVFCSDWEKAWKSHKTWSFYCEKRW